MEKLSFFPLLKNEKATGLFKGYIYKMNAKRILFIKLTKKLEEVRKYLYFLKYLFG